MLETIKRIDEIEKLFLQLTKSAYFDYEVQQIFDYLRPYRNVRKIFPDKVTINSESFWVSVGTCISRIDDWAYRNYNLNPPKDGDGSRGSPWNFSTTSYGYINITDIPFYNDIVGSIINHKQDDFAKLVTLSNKLKQVNDISSTPIVIDNLEITNWGILFDKENYGSHFYSRKFLLLKPEVHYKIKKAIIDGVNSRGVDINKNNEILSEMHDVVAKYKMTREILHAKGVFWRIIMKNINGILRKDTIIYTTSTIQIKIPKGTKIKRIMNVVTFEGKEGIQLFKVNGRYMVNAYGKLQLVIFPKGGQIPYPISLLRD